MKWISGRAPFTMIAVAMGLGGVILWSMPSALVRGSDAPPRASVRTAEPSKPSLPTGQFPDGAVGMCGRDDKWLGFTGAAVSIVTMVAPHLKAGDDRTALIRGANRAKAHLDAGLEKADVKSHGVDWVTRKSSTDPLVNVGMVWTYGLLGWNNGRTLPSK
jgi:hypothetical protein